MNEAAGAAVDGKRQLGVSKFLSKNKDRWKEKLQNNLSSGQGSNSDPTLNYNSGAKTSSDFTLSDDVADFLKPSTSKPRPVSPKAPRIGIDIAAAQKWASNAASAATGQSVHTPSSMRKKDYPRRALGLSVQFSNAAPEIIGEGGDESEEPVTEIARRLELSGQRSQRPALPPRQRWSQPAVPAAAFEPSRSDYSDQSAPALAARELLNDVALEGPPPINTHTRNNSFPTDEPDFVPNPIKRSQTRFSDLDDDHTSQSENVRPSMDSGSVYSTQPVASPSRQPVGSFARRGSQQVSEPPSSHGDSPLQIRTSRIDDLRLNTKRNSLSSPILQEKYHRMMLEEGQALHSAVEQDPFLDHWETSNRVSTSTIGSIAQVAGELSPRKSLSQNRASLQQSPPSNSSLQAQASILQSAIPSPGTSQPTPGLQPQNAIPPRKSVATIAADSQLRPSPTITGSQPSPRISPALNVSIPGRPDYFQQTNSGPPSQGSDRAPMQSSPNNSANYTTTTASSSQPNSAVTPGAALGEIALDDFADRCSHMAGIFRLQAEFDRPMYDYAPDQWLRAATWWFLRGRAGIEGIIRSRPRSADGRSDVVHGQEFLTQPHVDLAKTWWILTDVLNGHPKLRDWTNPDFGERSVEAGRKGDSVLAELFESCEILIMNLKSILASMKRNGVMPPTHALIQGQDQTIWVRYPDLAPTLLPILAGASGRALTEGSSIPKFGPLSVMAVADTRLDFSYSRCFVTALLGTDDPDIDRIPMPVLVSIMRERNDWHPKLAICTQKDLVTLCIQGDKKRGPSWQDVKWSESNRSLLVCLPHGYTFEIQLQEPDFRPLFNLYNHTFRVQSSLLPHANEKVVYETSLLDFQYKDSRSPPAFPTERVKRCRIRIFAKAETKYEPSGERKLYRGFRLLAVTSPKNRVLGSVSHDIGFKYPTLISGIKDTANPDSPAFVLYVQEDRRQCSLLMVFGNEQDHRIFRDTLNSFVLLQGESQVCAVRLKSLLIESSDQADAFSSTAHNPLARMQWREVLALGKSTETPTSAFEHLAPAVNLRVVAQAVEGTLTDRFEMGPGELMLRLSPDGNPDLTLLRPPQEALSITIDPSKSPQQLANELADIQRTVFMLPTIRTLSFFSHDDLHAFQAYITSFHVAYDGLAQAFTIARRRPVTALSRHKKLEAGTTRLQIVSHERQRVIQLLAFFDDMPQADSLNFQLKGVDEFERYDDKHSKGRYGVKFVDAKFTLPIKDKADKDDRGSHAATPDEAGRGKDLRKRFVCLDALETPAENDDIIVGFESEQEREKFLAALPAPPQAHRGLTIRRRI